MQYTHLKCIQRVSLKMPKISLVDLVIYMYSQGYLSITKLLYLEIVHFCLLSTINPSYMSNLVRAIMVHILVFS